MISPRFASITSSAGRATIVSHTARRVKCVGDALHIGMDKIPEVRTPALTKDRVGGDSPDAGLRAPATRGNITGYARWRAAQLPPLPASDPIDQARGYLQSAP